MPTRASSRARNCSDFAGLERRTPSAARREPRPAMQPRRARSGHRDRLAGARSPRRARPATRTATATAWSRWRASSRASPRRRRRRSALLLQGLDAQFDALEAQLAAGGDGNRRAAGAPGAAQRTARRSPRVVARVAAEAVDAVLLSARQHHACSCTRRTCRWWPRARPRRSRHAARGCCADAAIERGGCRVESDLGAVDARIDTPLGAGRRRARPATLALGRRRTTPQADA